MLLCWHLPGLAAATSAQPYNTSFPFPVAAYSLPPFLRCLPLDMSCWLLPGCDSMNMGSLKAELTFPPRFSLDRDPRDERDPRDGRGGGGGGGDDLLYPNASDGELDETTMILGSTPQARQTLKLRQRSQVACGCAQKFTASCGWPVGCCVGARWKMRKTPQVTLIATITGQLWPLSILSSRLRFRQMSPAASASGAKLPGFCAAPARIPQTGSLYGLHRVLAGCPSCPVPRLVAAVPPCPRVSRWRTRLRAGAASERDAMTSEGGWLLVSPD